MPAQVPAHDPRFVCLEGFVEALSRAGVQHVCISPGARSTPLVLTLANHPRLRAWSHIDERSSAFFALGIAKVTQRPVALVCTSGTAAANFLSAVVEAAYAHVPLIVLTADRPPELRDCGAAQTIDQIKLYGTHVKWFAEVGTPEGGTPEGGTPEASEQYFRNLGCRAAAIAAASPPGPVHLNFPFREPLMPQPLPGREAAEEERARLTPGHFTTAHGAVAWPSDAAVTELTSALAATPRGLIVCGPSAAGERQAAAVTHLAAALGYPVLADPTSQVRCGPHDLTCVLDNYDALLRDEAFAGYMAPEVVVRFGSMPTSKAFLNYLQRHAACRHIVVEPYARWNDPTLMAADIVPCDPVVLCEALCRALSATPTAARATSAWYTRWLEANRCARTAIAQQLGKMTELFEGKVFAELSQLLPDGAWVYVGNSMPVRDCESFWPGGSSVVHFLCNRGASGIDGFISSGLGAAAVSDQPVIVVTGDLAFYHDLNGLLAAKRYGLRATIVVLNNDGGGIFSFLPQAQCDEQMAEYFFTPHGLDFRGAVEMYGCAFTRVATWEQFREAVGGALRADRTSVIEVPVTRTRNVELHRQLWAAAARAIAEVVP